MSRLESLANILTKYCAAGVGGNVCVNITKYDAEMISKEIKDIQTENEKLKEMAVINGNQSEHYYKISYKQKQILDILKPYLEVSQDKYYYYVKLTHDYIITKKQYDILKEWLEEQ